MNLVLEVEAPPFREDATGCYSGGKLKSFAGIGDSSFSGWCVAGIYCAALFNSVIVRCL
jgi:hypothetical protein